MIEMSSLMVYFLVFLYYAFGVLFTYSMALEANSMEETPDWSDPVWWLIAIFVAAFWPVAMYYRYKGK